MTEEKVFDVASFVFTDEETASINEHADMIYNEMMGDSLLAEGVKDWVAGAVDLAKKGAGWVAEKVKWVTKAIAGAIAKFTGWIKKLWSKGFSYLAEFFGFEPVGMEVEI